MTSSDQIVANPVTSISHGRHLADELAETLKLAVPMALTQLGQIAMMTTDLALVGRLGEAPATAHLAQQYLFGLAWGILPALWFLAIRSFMGAINRPSPVLWITLVAIPTNGVLVYLLIHGAWGLPRLELFGAGLATSIVNIGTFLAGLWFVTRRRPFRKYHILGH